VGKIRDRGGKSTIRGYSRCGKLIAAWPSTADWIIVRCAALKAVKRNPYCVPRQRVTLAGSISLSEKALKVFPKFQSDELIHDELERNQRPPGRFHSDLARPSVGHEFPIVSFNTDPYTHFEYVSDRNPILGTPLVVVMEVLYIFQGGVAWPSARSALRFGAARINQFRKVSGYCCAACSSLWMHGQRWNFPALRHR